jgi:DNA-binding NarL/FixJ family response regulator
MPKNGIREFRIFIVDDSPIVVNRLIVMLSDIHEVSVVGYASNISSATNAILEIMPDVVLVDIHLKQDAPHANGIDLLITLRKTYPNMIIMMLSFNATPQYKSKCMALGANYFFDKSKDFDKIYEILKKMLENS